MPVYTVTAVCGGETDTALVTVDVVGQRLTVAATVPDPDTAPFDVSVTATGYTDTGSGADYTINWGDGTTPTAGSVTSPDPITADHTYAAGGTYEVTVTTTAHDYGLASVVVDAPLTVTADVTEDPKVTVTATNVAVSDTTVTVDWGDGTTPTTGVDVTAGTASASHTYAVDGTFTVTVTGDSTDESGTAEATVTGAPDQLPAPTGLALDPNADPPTESSFSVQWDAVAGATGYEATATGGSQVDWPGAVDASGDPVRASFSSLEAATEYTVTVAALGDGTTTLDSDPVTLTVSTTAGA